MYLKSFRFNCCVKKHTIPATGNNDIGVGFVGDNWNCQTKEYTNDIFENYTYWKDGLVYDGIYFQFVMLGFCGLVVLWCVVLCCGLLY